MGKVTFEFDENEDGYDIELIVHRHDLAYAFDKLKSFRRTIYKGYEPDEETVYTNKEKTKVYTKKDFDENNGYIADAQLHLNDDYVLRELDSVLDEVSYLLD